jgi:phenylpropionate dioxygenase-like ring-hydroxylating dioxygenase large terminal subunit
MYHPLCFTKDIPLDKPVALKSFHKNLVLWRTIQQPDRIQCTEDRCPHRSAQLSKGRLTADGTLSCGYHGWEFAMDGKCVRVPQLKENQRIPRSCHLKPMIETLTYNEIVYADLNGCTSDCPLNNGIHYEGTVNAANAFITDYLLEANYDFWIQLENLLDPAHIHFVHHGFQGDMSKAKYIRVVDLKIEDTAIHAVFTHDDTLIPDIRITYRAPGTVDVSILNTSGQTVRRNIIYTTPIVPGKCRVLFRDVAYKDFLVPEGWSLSQMLLGTGFIENTYQHVNETVVESIMEQDIAILESQQVGMKSSGTLEDYLASREILLTDSDAMIRAFRAWCKKNQTWLKSIGYS